jgi:hypothetical protein
MHLNAGRNYAGQRVEKFEFSRKSQGVQLILKSTTIHQI